MRGLIAQVRTPQPNGTAVPLEVQRVLQSGQSPGRTTLTERHRWLRSFERTQVTGIIARSLAAKDSGLQNR